MSVSMRGEINKAAIIGCCCQLLVAGKFKQLLHEVPSAAAILLQFLTCGENVAQ